MTVRNEYLMTLRVLSTLQAIFSVTTARCHDRLTSIKTQDSTSDGSDSYQLSSTLHSVAASRCQCSSEIPSISIPRL